MRCLRVMIAPALLAAAGLVGILALAALMPRAPARALARAARAAEAALVLVDGADRIRWANPAFLGLARGRLAAFRGRPLAEALAEIAPGGGVADAPRAVAVAPLGAAGRPRLLHVAPRASADDPALARDALTGLLNRDGLGSALARLGDGVPLGVICADIDRFKTVNDRYGHAAGDAVLAHVGRLLAAAVRPGDLVARTGGDEFVVVCPGIATFDELRALGARILARAETPARWRDRPIGAPMSLGLALSAAGPGDAAALIHDADTALYAAKAAGRGRMAAYDAGLAARVAAREGEAARLARGLAEGGVHLLFQPILAGIGGRPIAMAARPRWEHPVRGPLGVAEFAELLSDPETACALDRATVARALDAAPLLAAAADRPLPVAIALSAASLARDDLADRLRWETETRGLGPAALLLEVPVAGTPDPPGAPGPEVPLAAIRRAGFRLALGAVGAGPARLADLAAPDVEYARLDPSLVAGIGRNPVSEAVTEALAGLATRLGRRLVADGVDEAGKARRLAALGCGGLQGDGLCPAMPLGEAVWWLRQSAGASDRSA